MGKKQYIRNIHLWSTLLPDVERKNIESAYLQLKKELRFWLISNFFDSPVSTGDFLFKSTIFVLTIVFLLTHICFVYVLISRKLSWKTWASIDWEIILSVIHQQRSEHFVKWTLCIKIIFTYYYIFCVLLSYYQKINIMNNWEASKNYIYKLNSINQNNYFIYFIRYIIKFKWYWHRHILYFNMNI